MPTSYSIDRRSQLVRSAAVGVLTEDESWRHYEKLSADPDFDRHFSQICDLRGVTELEASQAFLRRLASRSIFAPSARRAFVAQRDLHYGLARMLSVFSELEGTEVDVFRTIEEAEEWLRIGETSASGS